MSCSKFKFSFYSMKKPTKNSWKTWNSRTHKFILWWSRIKSSRKSIVAKILMKSILFNWNLNFYLNNFLSKYILFHWKSQTIQPTLTWNQIENTFWDLGVKNWSELLMNSDKIQPISRKNCWRFLWRPPTSFNIQTALILFLPFPYQVNHIGVTMDGNIFQWICVSKRYS